MTMWEAQRFEVQRATRDGEMARDRHVAMHLRAIEVARERARDERRYVERTIGWLARAAQAATSWMA